MVHIYVTSRALNVWRFYLEHSNRLFFCKGHHPSQKPLKYAFAARIFKHKPGSLISHTFIFDLDNAHTRDEWQYVAGGAERATHNVEFRVLASILIKYNNHACCRMAAVLVASERKREMLMKPEGLP